MQLSIHKSILNDFIQNYKEELNTPLLVVSEKEILNALISFKNQLLMETSQIFFPLKVNSEKSIIDFLNQQGVGFEIASLEELDILIDCKIPPSRIIFGNPVKIKKHIQLAFAYGVNLFACDSESEINKIASFAPCAKVYIRVVVANTTSSWTLDKKFGANINQVIELFNVAKENGLNPCGISFHVGWNNTGYADWVNALKMCEAICDEIEEEHSKIDFINIGGGFPAHRVNQFEHLQLIASHINPLLEQFRKKGISILAEPGSFLVANAGVLIASVIDVIERDNERWVFIDTGIMQGFSWIQSGLEYDLFCINKSTDSKSSFIVTGPTCDSHDIFSKHVLLPFDICEGDLIGIAPAGAYISSSEKYNGFEFPKQLLV